MSKTNYKVFIMPIEFGVIDITLMLYRDRLLNPLLPNSYSFVDHEM